MGACLSKQQQVAVGPADKAAQVQQISPQAVGKAADTSNSSQQPASKQDAPSGPAEYTGAIAPVCELQRRQHLLDLDILYTVRPHAARWREQGKC